MSVQTEMSRSEEFDDPIRQRSGWLLPAGVFAITAVLSAMLLLFYLAPTPQSFIEEHPAPTSRTDPISVAISGMNFIVPSNYTLYNSARHDGSRKEVSLVAVFPTFRGYRDGDTQSIAANAANSPIIFFLIREEPLNVTESERLERIYLSLVGNPHGKPGPFGLVEYAFRDDSGYRGEDLFVGGNADDPVVMRCDRFTRQLHSPYCLRDMLIGHDVAVSYRFKRALLPDWRPISDGINRLVRSFRDRSK